MSVDAGTLPPITAKVGEFIKVEVPSNPTTGFFCCLADMPGCVYLESTEYVPDKPIICGSGGNKVYNFLAVTTGSGPIEFRQVKYTHPKLTIDPPGLMEKRFVIVE